MTTFLAMPNFGEDLLLACAELTIRSPVDEVFAIPELLERIILHLDIRTILTRAQLVNRTWKTVIEESNCIQQKLFFKPIVARRVEDVTQNRVKNPLLKSIFSAWFEERRDYSTESPFEFLLTPKRDAFLRKGASWRRMLVQQPACPKLGLIQKYPTHFLSNMKFASAVLDYSREDGSVAGVRMGAMYDLVYRIMAHRTSKCGMGILWRQPETEPAELEKYYYVRGQHEVVIKQHYTDDIGIVILQDSKTPGLATGAGAGLGHAWRIYAEDFLVWRLFVGNFETEYRSEGYEEVEVRFETKFEQDLAAGLGY
ncbi:hypothetical protein CkaCkLH20_02310 [Colletotrichum karsti]|uniref:F-box domain-containing protein n=1 Tax=Colletotrichum karsti TaxID=1095194 RepID=A0A9P6IGT7_9PEZI|nr:uncharacterized protein CkaCkLH20_02310 [Colletotrichum karsti]KAF9880356.1 hypothetical protein CkaCkLH20_02310 [Colletotrichum karsti]